jgi:hypothetical protein
MFQGVNEVGPFIAAVIYKIIATIILIIFAHAAGVLFKAATTALQKSIPSSLHTTLKNGLLNIFYEAAGETFTKMEDVSFKVGEIFFKTADDLTKFTKALPVVETAMKLSGVAGAVLAVMDILFTVGYSIAISVISDDVNDMILGLA